MYESDLYYIYKYMIDSDQYPDSIRHPLASLSQITVQFKGNLKSMSFSEPRSVCVFTHDGCGSSLCIICIPYYFKWMRNVKVPGINWMRLTCVSSTNLNFLKRT